MRAAVLLNYCCLPPSRAAIISKLSEASAAARLIYRRKSIMTFAVFAAVCQMSFDILRSPRNLGASKKLPILIFKKII